MDNKKRLSDDIAEVLLSQIVVEKKYLPGDKLPNEIDLIERTRGQSYYFKRGHSYFSNTTCFRNQKRKRNVCSWRL